MNILDDVIKDLKPYMEWSPYKPSNSVIKLYNEYLKYCDNGDAI